MAQPDFSPSADRNKQPIADLLRTVLPQRGNALEIASGTGQHVEWFATQFPGWIWQPTEVHRGALYNIEVRVAQADLPNVLDPVRLDVRDVQWLPDGPATAAFDLIFCANMLHIAPWEACAALMHGSTRHLAPGGKLITYGPYFESDAAATPSNIEFDQSLRAHDPTWGIRLREDVESAAAQAGLYLSERHTMPANNLLLIFCAVADNRAP